jgi:phosphoribosylformylglycinamidine cyclo-ligase
LKIAAQMKKFDTVGIDLVAMSVNDLICTGGEPLVFLDYLAMPKDDPALTKQLVQGISDGCVQAGCSLSGGETAILPDFYGDDDFDMAGFAAGVVERDRIIDGGQIRTGDVVIGLSSSGVHSNGYSLVRKVVFEAAKLTVNDKVDDTGMSVGEMLLTPTKIYVKAIQSLLGSIPTGITGLANITGGGIPDNVARILPPDCNALISRSAWPMPKAFQWLQKLGNVPTSEMDRVFNMGIGFVVICQPEVAQQTLNLLAGQNIASWKLGEIVPGTGTVVYG